MKQLSILTLFLLHSIHVLAQEYPLIPYPSSVITKKENAFELSKASVIYYSDNELKSNANYLQKVLNSATNFKLTKTSLTSKFEKGAIILSLEKLKKAIKGSYSLEVSDGVIRISASEATGIFYGIQTLLQLFPVEIYSDTWVENIKWKVPAVYILDEPKFEWRGMHLDVARNFKSVGFVKKFIDNLGRHKMNIFHWHLTEDQGWRIEIKKYPKLTKVGAYRDSTLIGHMRDKPHRFKVGRTGGYYTQEEIKDVVKYAQSRYITIVPEIEMPGHAQAAIAAYPEYGNTGSNPGVRSKWGISEDIFSPEEKTIEFLKDILDEVMELFPGKYIHIGGDEAKKTQWESSKRVKELLKERGLHDMHEMQSWFIKQISNHLTENNRKLIGWDEILEGGLANNATVMSWRGDKGGVTAAKKGSNAVMANSKFTYFSKYQSLDKENEPFAHGGFISLKKAYSFNPIPSVLTPKESKYIIGAQGQIWSEYIVEENYVEYMMFPRACALAEVVWSKDKDYQKFLERLKIHLKRLHILDTNYRVPDEFIK